MTVPQEIARLGGVADRRTLIALTSRAEVDAALRSGDVVRDARGRYALPVVDRALRAAHALGGTVSHRSAALHWGWEVKTAPARPTFPRDRRLPAAGRATVTAHWADLRSGERDGLVTSPRRTQVDCLRRLPFDEAIMMRNLCSMRSIQAPTKLDARFGSHTKRSEYGHLVRCRVQD